MKRFWLRIAVLLLLPVATAAGFWVWHHRQPLAWQWASYRVGAASTFERARTRIAAIEADPDRDAALRQLVRHWGAGNETFDLYLARYVDDPASSEAIRKAFSVELAWRRPLLNRWTHYWRWRSPQEPDREIAALVEYFDVLVAAEADRTITWRDVLDLQALFGLDGRADLARRLSPDNWARRYRSWQASRSGQLPRAARPRGPFPESPEIGR